MSGFRAIPFKEGSAYLFSPDTFAAGQRADPFQRPETWALHPAENLVRCRTPWPRHRRLRGDESSLEKGTSYATPTFSVTAAPKLLRIKAERTGGSPALGLCRVCFASPVTLAASGFIRGGQLGAEASGETKPRFPRTAARGPRAELVAFAHRRAAKTSRLDLVPLPTHHSCSWHPLRPGAPRAPSDRGRLSAQVGRTYCEVQRVLAARVAENRGRY